MVIKKEPKSKSVNKLDLSKVKKKQEELDNRSTSDFHEIKEGFNYYYIMPPWSDEGVIWKEVQQHGTVGVCPKAAVKKECILCEEIKKRIRKGDTDFADNNKLRSRAFFNAIKKDDIKKCDPSCVKILALSPSIFEEVISFITEEDRDISDPTAAVCLAIKRKGKAMRTRYTIKFGLPVDISKYVTDSVIEGLYDLDSIRAAQPAGIKDLRKAIRGAADEEDEDDEEDIEEDAVDVEEDVEEQDNDDMDVEADDEFTFCEQSGSEPEDQQQDDEGQKDIQELESLPLKVKKSLSLKK